MEQIPFLPISFFKHHLIQSSNWEPEVTFTSSGTTNTRTSLHAIPSLEFYLRNARRCFEFFFGPVTNYHFLALLPSYLERKGSSLIAMMDYFVKESRSDFSAFYLNDIQKLLTDLQHLRQDERKTILWGVSFALLDLAEYHQTDLNPFMVFETGGMKGRRAEITRAALHDILNRSMNAPAIYSEYGMTELLSQAYTKGENRFFTPPWMKVLARELTDPMQKGLLNETGGINVVDLANYHSVAFIETEDLGRVYVDGSFEVLGRLDNSDIRGCNLLIE
ncbi:MAG: acyl transferase [Marivirga sp.]|nr:acyl transferase [Marivirga sp.]